MAISGLAYLVIGESLLPQPITDFMAFLLSVLLVYRELKRQSEDCL